jgi:hypothetical protein
MEKIMDQVHDRNYARLYRLDKKYNLPDFVKQASTDRVIPQGEIPLGLYADPVHRYFPCHTKEALCLSYYYYLDQQHLFSKRDRQTIEDRFVKLAEDHNALHLLQQIKAAVEKANRPCQDDDDDYILFYYDGSEYIKELPVKSAADVKNVADFIMKHRDQFPFRIRQSMAERLLAKANQYGARLPDDQRDAFEKMAGYGIAPAADVAQMLIDRVAMSRKGPGSHSAAQEAMLKLAKHILENPSLVNDSAFSYKLASLVDDFDQRHGLKQYYKESLPYPEDIIHFYTNTKAASVENSLVPTIDGKIYSKEDLSKLSTKDIADLFGDAIASDLTLDGHHVDVEKVAEFIRTLPRGDLRLFEPVLEKIGIKPVAYTS